MPNRTLLGILLCATATPLLAQAAPAPSVDSRTEDVPTGVVRLTPEQREAALEEGAARAASDIGGGASDRRIHGEVGLEIGTGGARAAYGTAVVPLGDTGVAAVSVETDRSTYRWRRR